MRFGPLAPKDAVGAILAHSLSLDGRRLKKGTRLTDEHAAQLAAAGIRQVVVAQLEAGDLPEDTAAQLLAERLATPGLRLGHAATGRCNIHAEAPGVVTFEPDAVHRLNLVDEAMTLATLPPATRVAAGQMVATIKIIPYAVPKSQVETALTAAQMVRLRLHPFRPMRVALIQTRLPGQKDALFDKTERVTAARLAPLGLRLDRTQVVSHDTPALTEALWDAREDLVLIIGASAIADRQDVIPAAIARAGGQIERLGMPVDPGNLLCLGDIGGRPVLGLPGCARSPKPNGLDTVLERLVAGLPVDSGTIARMGVGGLIDEIPERPAPRLSPEIAEDRPGPVGAIILAAGQSRRMGPRNKLLIEVDGRPILAHVARAVREAGLPPPVVVTGCEADQVRAALKGEPVRFVHNPDFAQGLSTSIHAGISNTPEAWAGSFICLGDMPEVTPATLRTLASHFDPAAGRTICVPVHGGRRGNPVLWGRKHFPRLLALSGDVGAKHLLAELQDEVTEVDAASPGVLADVDTPEDAEALLVTRAQKVV